MIDFQRLKNDLLALGCLALSVFLVLSLGSYDPADPPASLVFPAHTMVANLAGQPGAMTANSLFTLLGEAAWSVVLLLVLADLRLFRRVPTPDPGVRLLGAGLLVAAVALTLQLLLPRWGHGPVIGSGGWVGAWAGAVVEKYFALTGGLIVAGTLALAGSLLAADNLVSQWCVSGLLLPFRILVLPFRPLMRRYEEPSSGARTDGYDGATFPQQAIPVRAASMPIAVTRAAERAAAASAASTATSAPAAPQAGFKVNLPLGGTAARHRGSTRAADAPPRRPFPVDWVFEPSQPPCGSLIYLRRTTGDGAVTLLGHTFPVDRRWAHRLIRVEVTLPGGPLRFYRLRRRDPANQPLLREAHYELPERRRALKGWH